jgi:archaellin
MKINLIGFPFLILILLLTNCSKEEETYDHSLNTPIDLSKLEGSLLLIAKNWNFYKYETFGTVYPANSNRRYIFNPDMTYVIYSDNEDTHFGIWKLDDNNKILFLDDQRWTVEHFNQYYLKISSNRHYLLPEIAYYLN